LASQEYESWPTSSSITPFSEIAQQNLDWDTLTVKAMLCSQGTWTPARGDQYVNEGGSDPAANELSGTGYTRRR
jgi:hypothetical protein